MEKSNYPPEGFPKRLYDAWIVSGMTQTEAAGRIGYERKTFCHWIHGDGSPNAVALVPDELKAPELTQQFEENLGRVNDGNLTKDEFLKGLLSDINKNIIKFTSNPIPDEQKIGYKAAIQRKQDEILGRCPKCGSDVKTGQYGAYCTGKCGMMFGQIRGRKLSKEQVKALLDGQKVYITGLKKKASGTYSAYFIPDGIEPYRYTSSEGTSKEGYQFKFTMEFKQKKSRR